jgi:hypothetical protein
VLGDSQRRNPVRIAGVPIVGVVDEFPERAAADDGLYQQGDTYFIKTCLWYRRSSP